MKKIAIKFISILMVFLFLVLSVPACTSKVSEQGTGIPSENIAVPENASVINLDGKPGHQESKPPFNWSYRYRFTMYVLDTSLDLPAVSRKRHLLKAMEGHIIQEGVLEGQNH